MAGTKPLRRAKSEDRAVQFLQDHAEQLDRVPILNGQLVSDVFPASLSGVVSIRHSLGRAYQGAFLCAVSSASGSVFQAYVPIAPRAAEAIGVDPKTHLAVTVATLPLVDQTVTFWVF